VIVAAVSITTLPATLAAQVSVTAFFVEAAVVLLDRYLPDFGLGELQSTTVNIFLLFVVGGMVDKPVIAVPTSVGYGASFGGVAALLGMLTSCASNVTVVNIDNGFGAAYVATLINRL
jgi:hypothetical protein